MKPDTERTKRYQAKLHQKRNFMHIHLDKEIRKKLNIQKRSLLIHKGDKVKVMRGSSKGKSGKIMRVDYNKRKVYVEAITNRTSRGKELLVALDLSNLLLIEPEMTKERKLLFKEVKEHKETKIEHDKQSDKQVSEKQVEKQVHKSPEHHKKPEHKEHVAEHHERDSEKHNENKAIKEAV